MTVTKDTQTPDSLLRTALLTDEGRRDPYVPLAALHKHGMAAEVSLGFVAVWGYEAVEHVLRLPGQWKSHPDYEFFRPYMTSFYLPKQEPKLEAAISAQIRHMYADGEMAKLITKWGGDPRKFLTPPPAMAKARQGVDRPSHWQPPTLPR